jgi:hypothetical protein
MSACIISSSGISGFVELAVIAVVIVCIHFTVKYVFNYCNNY